MLWVQAQNKLVSPGFMANWHHPVYQTLTQKDSHDPRNVICKPYLLSLICIPMQAKPNKSPLREGVKRLSPLRDWSAFPPQADHVLVDLFSSAAARKTLLDKAAPRSSNSRSLQNVLRFFLAISQESDPHSSPGRLSGTM